MAQAPQPQKTPVGLIIVIIGLVFLLVIGMAIGGYFIYKNYQTKKQNQKLQNLVNLMLTTTPIPTATATGVTSSGNLSTSPISACTKGGITANGYVFADSSARQIATSELSGLTPWQLLIARNEIYARHGRSFVRKDLTCYFNADSWYSINPGYNESQLSSVESKNISTILNYEKSLGEPCGSDTGC